METISWRPFRGTPAGGPSPGGPGGASLRVKNILSVRVAGAKAMAITNALGSDDNRFAEFGRFAQFLFVDRVLDKHDGSQMSLS